MSFTPVESQTRQIGPFVVVYLRPDKGSEGGHEIRLPDGHRVRVLPDGRTSGQKRSRIITEALTRAVELHETGTPPLALIVGHLAVAKLTWELQEPRVGPTLEGVIDEWLEDQHIDPLVDAHSLIDHLERRGYQITRTEETDR